MNRPPARQTVDRMGRPDCSRKRIGFDGGSLELSRFDVFCLIPDRDEQIVVRIGKPKELEEWLAAAGVDDPAFEVPMVAYPKGVFQDGRLPPKELFDETVDPRLERAASGRVFGFTSVRQAYSNHRFKVSQRRAFGPVELVERIAERCGWDRSSAVVSSFRDVWASRVANMCREYGFARVSDTAAAVVERVSESGWFPTTGVGVVLDLCEAELAERSGPSGFTFADGLRPRANMRPVSDADRWDPLVRELGLARGRRPSKPLSLSRSDRHPGFWHGFARWLERVVELPAEDLWSLANEAHSTGTLGRPWSARVKRLYDDYVIWMDRLLAEAVFTHGFDAAPEDRQGMRRMEAAGAGGAGRVLSRFEVAMPSPYNPDAEVRAVLQATRRRRPDGVAVVPITFLTGPRGGVGPPPDPVLDAASILQLSSVGA